MEIRIVPTDGIDPDQILNFRHQLAIKVRLDSFHQIFGTAGTKSVAVVITLILKIGLGLTLIFCLTHGAARCNIEVVFLCLGRRQAGGRTQPVPVCLYAYL